MTSKESADTRPQRKALGRGLSALLESRSVPAASTEPGTKPAPVALAPHGPAAAGSPGLHLIPLAAIAPNPQQPRKRFTAQSLEEMAASIRQHGILQPIVVSPAAAGKFQLVAGERRWRAAQLAGLEQIPALVQEARREQSLEIALIENLQREDLNPIEAAAAFERLAREFGLTHEEIAQRTGKDRATITNFLRLLRLPSEVQQLVADGKLSAGHAKALLALAGPADQRRLADEVMAEDLPVRATERLVARFLVTAAPSKQRKAKQWDANIRAALQDLERALGTRVRLSGSPRKGKLLIEYYSPEDLLRIYDAILKPS